MVYVLSRAHHKEVNLGRDNRGARILIISELGNVAQQILKLISLTFVEIVSLSVEIISCQKKPFEVVLASAVL